jgi:hypothetical protein
MKYLAKNVLGIMFTTMVLSTCLGAILMMGGNGIGIWFMTPGIIYICIK